MEEQERFESDPVLLAAIAEGLAALIPPGIEMIAGLELGGVPVATALARMANPRPTDRETFFAPVRSAIRAYRLDFSRLDTLRENRDLRGFPWRRARHLS